MTYSEMPDSSIKQYINNGLSSCWRGVLERKLRIIWFFDPPVKARDPNWSPNHHGTLIALNDTKLIGLNDWRTPTSLDRRSAMTYSNHLRSGRLRYTPAPLGSFSNWNQQTWSDGGFSSNWTSMVACNQSLQITVDNNQLINDDFGEPERPATISTTTKKIRGFG